MGENLVTASFDKSTIRRVWDEETEQWYFSVVDVVEALTESTRPSKYWSDLKKRVKKQSDIELSAFCGKSNGQAGAVGCKLFRSIRNRIRNRGWQVDRRTSVLTPL